MSDHTNSRHSSGKKRTSQKSASSTRVASKSANSGKVRRKRKAPRVAFTKNTARRLSRSVLVAGLVFAFLCVWIVHLNVESNAQYNIEILNLEGQYNRDIPYRRGDIKDRNGNILATSVIKYKVTIDRDAIYQSLNDEKIADEETRRNLYYVPAVKTLVEFFGETQESAMQKIEKEEGIDNSRYIYKDNLDYEDISDYFIFLNGKTILGEPAEAAEDKEETTDVLTGAKEEEKDDWKDAAGVRGRVRKVVQVDKYYKRQYPGKDLACSVVGFKNEYSGVSAGIEKSFDDELTGVNGREYTYLNAGNEGKNVIKDAQNGDDIISTIDINIQQIVEEAIDVYMEKYQPLRLAVVVADPNNGEILAMADDLKFDPNDPQDIAKYYSPKDLAGKTDEEKSGMLQQLWDNYCVSSRYEPGSTFKPFTVAAAYEEGAINESNTFVCDGYKNVDIYKIKCHTYERGGHGTLDVVGAVAGSCNVALMDIANMLGIEKFYQYVDRFGFAEKTGIELPNENTGAIPKKEHINYTSLATNSFGQNITVNMIQMTAAFGSIVNGGNYYEPHIVRQVRSSDGSLVNNYSKTLISQTVTKETSTFLKKCIRAVVTEGTGSTAAMEGYTVGGKTGTAQKLAEGASEHMENEYILSFLGCVPCENPQVICYTIMDSPKDNTQATEYNTEFWRYIMERVLPYMGIDKTEEVEKKAIDSNLATEFYSNGLVEDESGQLVKVEDLSEMPEDETSKE